MVQVLSLKSVDSSSYCRVYGNPLTAISSFETIGLGFAPHHAWMPRGLLKLRVPEDCPVCHVPGTVTLETTVAAGEAVLRWCCRSCGYEWLITEAEITAAERRAAPRDRRRTSRNERRRRE
jgi:hypothetical protein